MMNKWIISASVLALGLPGAAFAQQTAPTTSTSASTPTTGDVSASTGGSATGTQDSVGVSGTGEAQATNGGNASTQGTAKFNQNTASQRSVATARDDDERARSMTRSRASKNGADMSRSMSIYKQQGEKPVISRERVVTTPKEKAASAP